MEEQEVVHRISTYKHDVVDVRGATFRWNKESEDGYPVLNRVDLTVGKRECHVIVGSVGAGKVMEVSVAIIVVVIACVVHVVVAAAASCTSAASAAVVVVATAAEFVVVFVLVVVIVATAAAAAAAVVVILICRQLSNYL